MKGVVIPGQRTPGWPRKKLKQLNVLTIEDMFAREWHFDAHFTQYAVVDTIGPYRYTNEAFASEEFYGQAIEMQLVVIDVDSPAKRSTEAGAVDRWWDEERARVAALLHAHPGMAWRTKGGWRGVWTTSRRLRTSDEAKGWRRDYLAFVAYLERTFEVLADPACADWGRLQRVPFGMRDGEESVVRREVLGALAEPIDLATLPNEEDRSSARFRWKNAWREPTTNTRHTGGADESAAPLFEGVGVWERILRARGLVLRELDARKLAIECPNKTRHTTSSETSTVLYRPSAGEIYGHIHCSHAHCAGLDFKAVLGVGEEEWRGERLAPVIQLRSISAEEEDARVISELIPDPANPSRISGIAGNVAAILLGHSVFKGRLAYDTFRHCDTWVSLPDTLKRAHAGSNEVSRKVDVAYIQSWLLRGDMRQNRPPVSASIQAVESGIRLACAENSFDSLERHVLSVDGKWDGEPRLERWLQTYFGAEDTPLVRAMGQRWLVAAVARALRPGCVADMMPILMGKQGIGKGYALKILFGDEYVTILGGYRLGTKDADQRSCDSWCAIDDELVSTTKSGLEYTKSYVTETKCKFRKAHEPDFITVPRRYVLVGTSNEKEILTDNENRRFWPIICHQLLHAKLIVARDQLISEAIQYFRSGYEYRILDSDTLWEDLSKTHGDARFDDPLVERITSLRMGNLIGDREQISHILQLLGYRVDQWNDVRVLRLVGRAMRAVGYTRNRIGRGSSKLRVWEWPHNEGCEGDKQESIQKAN